MQEKRKKRVLSDHKKVGTKFVPPLLQLGAFHESRWSEIVIPEIVWLALLNHCHGLKVGGDLCLAVAKEACAAATQRGFFGFATEFHTLSSVQREQMCHALRKNGALDPIADALVPLLTFYPQCPLNFLFNSAVPMLGSEKSSLNSYKRVLDHLYDRKSKEATFAQANAIYIAFVTGRLSVCQGLSLASFPEIASYPATEKSEQVAAGVRMAINVFIGSRQNPSLDWPRHFWRRGLELEPCDLNRIYG